MVQDSEKERVLILGAAGRDFHNFNVMYRNGDPLVEVVGFTATQIPHIDCRRYPPELSGPFYEKGLPIWPEDKLESVIKEQRVDRCMLAYSDLHHHKVMEIGARCLSAGAEFFLAPPRKTMLKSSKPVIAICAVRTGCGKSQTSRYAVEVLKRGGKKGVVVRHPMPYGNLAKQAVQRFEKYEDLKKHDVTIEEREEYEQHLKRGTIVYAGVDYEAILRQAEKEADVVIWDGGNNDTPFYNPDLWITVTDPHRAGNELTYYPGDVNFRCADAIIINKANTAGPEKIESIKKNAKELNPAAHVYITNSEVELDAPDLVRNKKVLLVEDGPTLTHGEMEYGAGKFAAEKYQAQEIVDPRPYLKGSLEYTYKKYPHLGKLIPAMGYWAEQIKDLEETINSVPCDAVIIATPMDLRKIVDIKKPAAIVTYGIEDRDAPYLYEEIEAFMKKTMGDENANGGKK